MDDPAVAKGADPYEAIRRVAEEALESEDWPDADRNYAELNRAGALTPGDARRWVTALEHASAGHRDASTLRQLAECFPDEDDVVEFVAGELWRRAEELSEAAGPAADLTMAQLAWGSALMLAPPLARSDDDAIRMIGLLDRLYQAGRRSPNPIGTFSEFEQALLLFAAAGPQATLRAADLLSAEDPQLALDLVAGRDESAETVLVSAVASSELDDFSRAATLFDHLAIRWGIMPRDMDVEDRSRWVQAMTDVGRFEEAELACGRTTEPWTVKVLAAMLALRRGDDATAHQMLGESLPQRRHDVELRVLAAQAALISGDYKDALRQAMSLTDGVPEHILERTIRAECEFESALAMANDVEGAKDSVENVQRLMSAVKHYRRTADLHRDTTEYLSTGRARPGAVIGSEPLAPRLYAEICRRGMHAAILAQEGLARLGLRGDRQLVMDARDLTHHLRSVDRECCRRASTTRGRRLLHQIRHLPDRDEAARLAMLMISYQKARWQRRAQNALFLALGATVAWLAVSDQLPGESSDSIRVMVLAVGVLLLLMPFARSLKVGVVELSRDAPSARSRVARSRCGPAGSCSAVIISGRSRSRRRPTRGGARTRAHARPGLRSRGQRAHSG